MTVDAEKTTGWLGARSVTRAIVLDDVFGFVHPSGQGAVSSASMKLGPSSGACPLTEARGGLQQQWPSSMQQAIEQTSDEVLARLMGAEMEPINKAIAASSARSLAE